MNTFQNDQIDQNAQSDQNDQNYSRFFDSERFRKSEVQIQKNHKFKIKSSNSEIFHNVKNDQIDQFSKCPN